jgi:transposase
VAGCFKFRKSNRKLQRDYDQERCKARHLIKNFFAKLKLCRSMATRYDKTARNFLQRFNSPPQLFGSFDDRP